MLVAMTHVPDGAAFFDMARNSTDKHDARSYGSVAVGSTGQLEMRWAISRQPTFRSNFSRAASTLARFAKAHSPSSDIGNRRERPSGVSS